MVTVAAPNLFGIQIASILCYHVTTSCTVANIQFYRSLEADEVIEYRTIDVVKHLQREGTSYDVLIGNVNSPRLYWDAHHDLGDNGQYIDQV
jgi:NADPH:quinone reductase-like Zn-dependent oxidoreductase